MQQPLLAVEEGSAVGRDCSGCRELLTAPGLGDPAGCAGKLNHLTEMVADICLGDGYTFSKEKLLGTRDHRDVQI